MSKSPGFPYLFKKILKLSLTNIWRNKALSLATVFVIGAILFIFNVILAVNFIAQSALNDLNQKIDITVYLKESTTFEQGQKLAQEISTFEGVKEAKYLSKEDALKEIKKTHPDISLSFEKYKLGNPLPASLSITTLHPSYHLSIAQKLNQNRYQIYMSNVSSSNNKETAGIVSSVSKNLIELTSFSEQVIFWLVITFIIGGALIILNALQITIFSRKQEISVMKLVGASHWFIKSPFIVESIIYGIFAVILSFLMLIILATNVEIKDSSLWSYYNNLNFYIIFQGELLTTILLSIISSSIATHEYLKKDFLTD